MKSLSIQISEALLERKSETIKLKNAVAVNIATDKETKLTGTFEVVGSSEDGTIVSDSSDELFTIKE